MRTGLIPNAYATVEDASTPLVNPVPHGALRHHLRVRADLLDRIADAAARGEEAEVVVYAGHLATVRKHTHTMGMVA